MSTAVTPRTLKARAEPFCSMTDARVQTAIDEAVRWLSEDNWGTSHFDDGVFYLACHILEEDAALNATTAGGAQGALPGSVESERVLSWSVSYATPQAFVYGLPPTASGRRFLARRELVFSSRCL